MKGQQTIPATYPWNITKLNHFKQESITRSQWLPCAPATEVSPTSLFLERFWRKCSRQNLQTWQWYFWGFENDVGFLSYLISDLPRNNCTKMYLKINPSVKTSWQACRGSCLLQVMGPCLSGLRSKQKRKNIYQQQQQLLWKVIPEVLFLKTNCSAGEEHLSKIFNTLFQLQFSAFF